MARLVLASTMLLTMRPFYIPPPLCSHYGNDAAVAHLAAAERELRERREREIAEAEEQVSLLVLFASLHMPCCCLRLTLTLLLCYKPPQLTLPCHSRPYTSLFHAGGSRRAGRPAAAAAAVQAV